MIDKLISTTKFVQNINEKVYPGLNFGECKIVKFNAILNYVKFISQPLKIEMFVCSVKEPFGRCTIQEQEIFEKARYKVLFKNFEQEDWIEEFGYITLRLDIDKQLYSINYNVETKEFFFDGDNCDIPCKTIEGLLPGNIELTEACLKQLKLN